jgi:hypothetical protein
MAEPEEPKGPKITLHEEAPAESPSAQLVKQALKEEVVVDERGRKLTMRKPGVLAQYRLAEALGELASNQTYMQMCNPLMYLAAIDGDPVVLPSSKLQVEALIQQLDDDGLAAAMSWYVANVIAPTMQAIEAAEKAARDKEAIKN